MTKLLAMLFVGIVVLTSPDIAGAETVGRGDMEFFIDTASFRNVDGTTRTEVYIRIPNIAVRFKEMAEQLEAQTRVAIKIVDAEGTAVANEVTELKMYAADTNIAESPLGFQTLTKRYTLAPGSYRLSCAIEDLNSPKVTIVGMIRSKVKTALVDRYPFTVPVFIDDKLTFSDAKFLWSPSQGGIPNPSRLYGLYRDSLRVYVEAYVPSVLAAETLQIRTVILNELGEAVTESSAAVEPQSPQAATGEASGVVTMPVLITEDLNRLAAGTYALYVNGGLEQQLLVRMRSGKFNIAWDMRTWEISRRSFVAEARFLLDPKDFDRFIVKDVGEQEALLAAMWEEIDPDPATGVNEAYEEFLDRLEYVNAKYTDYQLGILTDRGLIYLKYGPPDEKIVDVIPLNRESLSDALEKVQDRFHAVNFSNTGGRIGYARPSRDIIVDPRRLGAIGEGGDEGYPYELWVYNGPGHPILEKDETMEPDIGLRFIFVDREGYGRYKLESSSSMGNK